MPWCGRSNAQRPYCGGAEDQAEAQRLPKMAPRNAGGRQGIRQQHDGCPASRKERCSKGRFPTRRVHHPNEQVQTRDVEQSTQRGKAINPASACAVVPPCRPEVCAFRPCVEMLKLGVSPSHVVAEEHVPEDEGCHEDGKPQKDRSRQVLVT